MMRKLAAYAAVALLAGCGVETASTAAAGAAIKKQELEQGRNTMERAQKQIDAATAKVQSRAEAAAEASDK